MGAKGSMPIENLQFQECIFFGLFGKDCSSRSRRRRSAAKLQHREQLGKSLSLLHNKSFKSLVCYIYIYAFSRRFYPKRLTVHSGYTYIVSMCVLWELNPQTFALLT